MADAMLSESISSLVETIRRHRLLEPAQAAELGRFAKPAEGAHALASDLVRRGWLTAYQANQLLAGRGAALVFGSYIVMERLGEGATGQVLKARHVHMRRVVAIKVIRPELLTDAEVVARFYREIQVTSRLTHPHVVHAYDAGPIGRTHFLTMEFVEGINLADLVQRDGPLPAPKACEFVRQAALGLQHAHEKGLVHRDIKPSNLILTQASSSRSLAEVDLGAKTLLHGIVKVLDLGLARLPRNKDEAHSPALTMAGRGMMGTPDYLAPEQALDLSQADIRSDLYSLGCVLYFLLTGQPPFPGGTLAQKLMKHQQAPPPPLAGKRPGLSPKLSATVNRLLAKNPNARFQTPAELAAALAPLAGCQTVLQPASGNTIVSAPISALRSRLPGALRKRRWLLTSVGGAVLLGTLFLVFGMLLSRRNPGSGSTDLAALFADVESPVVRPLLARLRRYHDGAAEDPEPLRQAVLAVQRDHGGTPESLQAGRMMKLLPSPLDRWNSRPASFPYALPPEVVAVLGDPAGRSWSEVTCLAASPAGKRVAGGGRDGVVRIWHAETLQETATLRGEGAPIAGVTWSADGQTLAAADNNHHVFVWSLAGATPRLQAKMDLPAAAVNGVALAPGGKSLAATNADGKVHLWELGGPAGAKEIGTVSGPAGWAHGVAYSPDGKVVAAGFADGTIGLLDMTTKKLDNRLWKAHAGPVRSLSFSADSKLLATTGASSVRLWALDNPPRNLAAVTYNGQPLGVSLAPNGRAMAVALPIVEGIHLWDVTANPVRQTILPAGHLAPVQAVSYSPDGKTLFSGGLDRTVRQWDVTAAPPRERKSGADATGPGQLDGFALSLDSQFLATHARSTAFLQLWDLNGPIPRSRDRLPLPSPAAAGLTFAPDGKYLGAITASQPTLWDLSSAKPRAVSLPTLPGQGISLSFAPDSRTLAVSNAGDQPAVRLWQLGSQLREQSKFATPGIQVFSLAFTVDGKELGAVGSDQKARFWGLESGNLSPRPPLPEPTGPFGGLGFGPDGNTLAVFESREGRVALWDRTAGKPQARLTLGGVPLCRVHTLAFAPDGHSVALAGNGPDSVSLWELPSGRKVRSWSLPGPVDAVEFASDGRHLLTLNGNGTAYLFRLTPPPGIAKK